MISANGGLPAHRYTPQVTQRRPRGSEPASVVVWGAEAGGAEDGVAGRCGGLFPLLRWVVPLRWGLS